MAEWRETTLGDVVEFQRGFDITRAEQRNGRVPVVSSGGVSSFHDQAMVGGPGVVVGRKGTLGKAFYIDVDYWPHDTTLWVKDFKGNSPRYVYYFMSEYDVSWLDAGSANPTLNRNHLHPVRVVWPDRRTQDAIADVLGALDDKIAVNTKLATTADEMALALASSLPVSVALQDITEVTRKTVRPAELNDSMVAHFSLPAFDATGRPETVEPASIKSAKFLVDSASVLVSKLNPRFPRVWNLADLPNVPALASTEFVVLRPRYGSSSVLWSLVAQQRFGAALEGMVAGTSGSHQRVKPAEMLEVLVPDPRELSADLVARIEAITASARSARKELPLLEATRDALLPALMSGRLRVEEAVEVAGL